MFSKDTDILIVDDMVAEREHLKGILQAMGFSQIHEADEGSLAVTQIEVAAQIGKPIQLVIADWNMPVMNGFELLKAVRASDDFRKLPFVLLTSVDQAAGVIEAIKAGVSDYIVKPATREMVEKKLTAVWNKHRK